ncbi:MAG: hypothetical protein JWM16_3415 [Verrucomicrobiales bacterium]|nr:hypothetical protein [Verrucomicrobiales bacterium]
MRLLLGLVVGLVSICAGWAAGSNDFLVCSHTNRAGQVLPYRLLVPNNYDSQRSYPVILYLHGAAARGTNNAEPLNWGPLLFLDEALRAKHQFFLVVPQCPLDSGWLQIRGARPEWSDALEHSVEVVAKVLPAQYRLDPKRRYITGVSMGGGGVWMTVLRRPSFFAAAVPVCASGFPDLVVPRAAEVPVWVFHSDDDHIVPVHYARDMVSAWKKNGGKPKYTEYTGLKHSSWKKAYTEMEMFDWLFQQHNP